MPVEDEEGLAEELVQALGPEFAAQNSRREVEAQGAKSTGGQEEGSCPRRTPVKMERS